MNERITMKGVADRAGVSQATVSLSLANHPRIPEETRTKIQTIARSLGYEPNPYVAALMRSRRRGKPLPEKPVIAVVCAGATADAWRRSAHALDREVLQGILEQATARGYRGDEVWLRAGGMSDSRFSEVLRARGIRGVILGPLEANRECPELAWEEVSAVRIGVPLPREKVRTVCPDHFAAGAAVFQECLALGYRRPGVILRPEDTLLSGGRWESGVCSAFRLAGLEGSVPVLSAEQKNLGRMLQPWLVRHEPDVVITVDHESVVREAAHLGLRVPRDLGVASLLCHPGSGLVSGVLANGRLVGSVAVDMLVDMMERHERGLPRQPSALMISGLWRPGQTLRARALSGSLPRTG